MIFLVMWSSNATEIPRSYVKRFLTRRTSGNGSPDRNNNAKTSKFGCNWASNAQGLTATQISDDDFSQLMFFLLVNMQQRPVQSTSPIILAIKSTSQ